LKEVATRLQTHTRSTDICARVGGDEFIVIGTQLENPEQAYDIAKKLLDQLTTQIPAGGAATRSAPASASASIPSTAPSWPN
jgi:diguanylate cyclase (GGDEF)-like protein